MQGENNRSPEPEGGRHNEGCTYTQKKKFSQYRHCVQ